MKEHSSQRRGILAALLLAVFAGVSLKAADAKFIVAAKGQRWMQTNAGAAVAVPGSNHVFMVSVDTAGPDTITNGFLILPNATSVPLEGDGPDHGGLEAEFISKSLLDVAFPNGVYKVVTEGVSDGKRTNAVSLTGDSYPTTPHFNSFSAAQAIDPSADFNLTWEAISGATANDFIIVDVVDCTDENIVSTPPPGQPNALIGTATNFLIRARSLRPGMAYKVKLIVAHFTTYDTTNYPGAILTAGYLTELFMPLTTTGTPVDCPPGRLQLVFNFPPGGFDNTNGVISFPTALTNYSAQLEAHDESTPPEGVTFSGPNGSGLSNTPDAWSSPSSGGIWFGSPFVALPPFPPGGVYSVNYDGDIWSFNLLDPNAASQQLLMIPTIVLGEGNLVKEVRWRFTDTNGISMDAPPYVDDLSFQLSGMSGMLYHSDNGGEPMPRTTTSHELDVQVPWEAVNTVTMTFRDIARNTFVSSFHRGSGEPNFEIVSQELSPGSVGRTYGASVQVNGGQPPYEWTIQNGNLPPGLTISSSNGAITGTPNALGSYEFNVRVTDSTDLFISRGFNIVIFPNGGGGGGENEGPDIRFFAAVKGQHWVQTNSTAVPEGEDSFVFMSFAEPNHSDSLTNATITPPGGTPITLESEFEEDFNYKQSFVSQSTLDGAFPNGDYTLVTGGLKDGVKTNSLILTGNGYPGTPQLSNFSAAQAIDPTADFTLTWNAISGATAEDYLSVEISDCQDEHVLSTSAPGKVGALSGTNTSLLIPARTLRPGQLYKLTLFVIHFTAYDTNSYPGATGIAGYYQETAISMATTGTPVGCAQGRLFFSFNFGAGTLAGTNGSATFPHALEHYSLHYELQSESEPPETVTFTGPGGSGLNNTTSGNRHSDGFHAAFSTTPINVPPFPPGGVYTVNYSGNNREFNLLDPIAASQQVLLIPTLVVSNGNVIEVRWRHADTNGNTITPPSFIAGINLTMLGANGPIYSAGFDDEPLPGSSTSHVLYYPVPWDSVLTVQLQFRDAAGNSFASMWNRSDVPPPGLSILNGSLPPGETGSSYDATLQATGGEPPYAWSMQAGNLPAGLELDPETGDITGTPAASGVTEFVVRVTDSQAEHTSRSFILVVTGGTSVPPAIRSFVLFKGQEFMQTNASAAVSGTNLPFHFEAFVEGNTRGAITNAVLRSPRNTNYVLEADGPSTEIPSSSGGERKGEGEGEEDDSERFGIEGRYVTKPALDAIYNSGTYTFFLGTSDGSNRTATINLPGDSYPATPHIANWSAAQVIDAFVDFTLTWDAFTGGTTNDFVQVQIEDESGTVFESNGPRQPDSLTGKSTSFLVPAETLAPGHEYKCSVFFAKFSVVNTNAIPGALGIGAYAKATFFPLNTLTPPPPEGQLQFSAPTFSISESNEVAEFTVIRSGGSEGAVSVDFSTSDGTAHGNLDYVPTEGTLDFAEGETSVTFTFEILGDEIFETNETVRLTLSNPEGGATLGGQSNAVMIITDNDAPGTAGLLQFSVASYTVSEASATVTLTVTRTGGKAGEVAVDFITVDGSARGEEDFTSDGSTLNFPDGVTSQTIVIQLSNDALDETNETFEVALDNPSGGASLGTRNVATVSITDNDNGGELKFSAAAVKIGEADGEAHVTITRSGGTAEGVTVDVIVTDVTTTADDDYAATTETVEFEAGATTAIFTLAINNDDSSEGDETLQLELINPTGGASLGRGTNATVMIVDDEVSFQLSAESYTVNEAAATVVLTVTRSGPTTGTSTVDYSTLGDSAEADVDFVGTNGTVTFGPGVSSRTFIIRILGDDEAEEDETFGVELSNPDGGQLGNLTEAVVNLVDNDLGGELNFRAAGFIVKEDKPFAVVVVTRTDGKAGGVTFDFTTADGSAEDGDDYTGVTETIEFGAGDKSVNIEVPILNDALDETNETVHLTISNPTGGATLGELDSATLTITDNDDGGQIVFSAATYSINETGTTATITVKRTKGTAEGVTVGFITAGGTATPGVDFTGITNTLTFGSNELQQTFTIDIENDEHAEGNETVFMALSNPGGGASLGKITNSVLTIVDDEKSLQFSSATHEVVEGKKLALVINRGGPLAGPVTVQYTITAGTATAGVDYTATTSTGTITFSSGAKSKTLSIPIKKDTVIEADETFTVTLSNPSNGVVLGANDEAAVTITGTVPATRISRAAVR